MSVAKVAAWVLCLIHAAKPLFAPNPVPIEFLAERTGIAPNHLQERPLKRLLDAPLLLIERQDGGYVTPEDVESRLDKELDISGCKRALEEQQKHHKEQRKINEVIRLHYQGQVPEQIAAETGYSVDEVRGIIRTSDRAPSLKEMREDRALRNPDGTFSELEKHSPKWDTFVAPDDHQPPIANDVVERLTSQIPSLEDLEPCIHSYGPTVFPGGKGCYCCDASHPYRVAS